MSSQAQPSQRRFPVGVEPSPAGDGGAHVRVWAPGHRRIEIVHGQPTVAHELDVERGGGGYFSGLVPWLREGDRYGFRLDRGEKLYPDPASRFQPEGPHGLSEVIDAGRFAWSDGDWRGLSPRGQVIYELHVGTFTPEGTYAAAAERLPMLRELGVTVVEVMPLHEFPGRFGWGYDGVNLWAPSHLYGRPDDLRRFIDAAHGLGLGVILDVVYNHLGPDGNYLPAFSPDYFTDRYKNDWGAAINFDGEGAAPVRELFVENAAYWIDEFHFDGLRLDATQSIIDASPEHVIAVMGRRVREAAGGRAVFLVAENEPQETRLVRAPASGGYGLDALWNDDFHHTALVTLTGRTEAYYTDYGGTPQELLSAIRWGYLFQGQRYEWQKQARGTPALDLLAENFVLCLENHDQVANSGRGARLSALTMPEQLRAMTALFLLAPGTPLLFQGQEFGSTRRFVYFADHGAELGAGVTKGRLEFLAQFPSLATPESQRLIADPTAEATFTSCKLDWSEREAHEQLWALHRDLLALRREDAAFRQQRADAVHGAVLGPEALLLRYLCPAGDRLLLANFGRDQRLERAPEPLLAPPPGQTWKLLWSSEDPRYGGDGARAAVTSDGGWNLPGHAVVVLAPGPIG
jgi:maltooligosyltrehalose trehalohydrolase